jgi:hypothetical protein
MSQQDRHEVERALKAGMGMARFAEKTVSYGTRNAYFPGLSPAMLDGSELSDFVSPAPVQASKRSPLMDAVGGPPQIARPRVDPTVTERPDVQFEMRTSSHPRGDSEYLNAQRFAPGRAAEAAQPQEPLTEEQQWFAQRLGQQR